MNICVASNQKYLRYLYIMLLSLFENNRNDNITVFLLERDLTPADTALLNKLAQRYGQAIRNIKIDGQRLEKLPTTAAFSVETYFRLLMPYILPEAVDRVLYLDVDILVEGSLRDLYETELGKNLFAACKDLALPKLDERRKKLYNRQCNDSRYFNAGVMLWDIAAVRKKYELTDFLKAAEEIGYDLPFVDQDLLNYMVYDQVLYLDAYRYNFQIKDVEDQDKADERHGDPVIVHFSGCSPWNYASRAFYYKKWWQYAKKTPFYFDLLEGQNDRIAERYFEQDFLMVRDARDIAELLLEEKGTGKLEEFIRTSDKKFWLYGAGHTADIFLRTLNVAGIEDKLQGIFDRVKSGIMYGLPIKPVEALDKEAEDAYVVVTVMTDPKALIRKLKDKCSADITFIPLKKLLRDAMGVRNEKA